MLMKHLQIDTNSTSAEVDLFSSLLYLILEDHFESTKTSFVDSY